MTQPNDGGTDAGKTFTQAEVDAIVRDRLTRERAGVAAKYGDYDDLKAKATQADADKGKLDQVLSKLSAAEDRAVKAELAKSRSDVATAKKLPPFLARRLTGNTAEELAADADEMLAEYVKAGGKIDGGTETTSTATGDGKTPPAATAQPAPRAPRGRPQETLTPGAPVTTAEPEITDPLALAALIPRR